MNNRKLTAIVSARAELWKSENNIISIFAGTTLRPCNGRNIWRVKAIDEIGVLSGPDII